MPKTPSPLTDAKIKGFKPLSDKNGILYDGHGLFMTISPTGFKAWRYKYRFAGKSKTIPFGPYPAVSLADARAKRAEVQKQLSNNIDPGQARRAEQGKSENTFEAIARERHEKFKTKLSAGHAERTLHRLENHVFPVIGSMPINEIHAPDLLRVLHKMESNDILESAHRVKSICGQIFRYAVATGRADRDITYDLKGALPPSKIEHLAALTEPKDLAGLLRAIDSYEGSFIVKCAMQLQSMFFCRPGELRNAQWSEIDLDAGQWSIPAEKMKMKIAHMVPLSRQAIEILKQLQTVTGQGPYVFPSHWSSQRPMSNNAVLAALRRMDYTKEQMTGHGFRAIARTLLDEILHIRPDIIEHQLAHSVKDPLGRAYNRTSHLDERRKMMQVWADYLDGLKQGAKIIPFPMRAV